MMGRYKSMVVPCALLVVSAAPLIFLILVVRRVPQPRGLGADALPGICIFLSRSAVVYAMAAIWVMADVALAEWTRRSIRIGGASHRPAALFFVWQTAKLAYFVLYISLAFFHKPYSAVGL
jgi:hypothetical protein